jgi:peptide/nickel transport system substrate-binding protein
MYKAISQTAIDQLRKFYNPRRSRKMKKRNTLLALLGVVFLLSLFLLAACGNDPADPETDDTNGQVEDGTDEGEESGADVGGGIPAHIQGMIQRSMPSSDDVVEGGTLRFAHVAASPFAGVLHPLWSSNIGDSRIQDFFLPHSMMTTDENFLLELGDEARGAAVPVISEDGLTITFTLRDGMYWHDGEPVTAHDWKFTYLVLASAEYAAAGGQRFGQQSEHSIVGIMDFHNGDADDIEGIQVLADNVLEITYEEIVPLRSTYFMPPLPYHIFKDIPIEEMQDSPYVRTADAIGFGPFILDVIVPGESVTFVRNDNFWDGPPVLDGVEFRVVNPEIIGEEMAAGNVDIADTFREADFPYFEDLSNVTFLKNIAFVYNYIGFRLGEYDMDIGESVLNPDATMANDDLRRAMWMAVDNNAVSEAWFSGLRWDATSLIPPAFKLFHDSTIQRPPFDVDAANALLDEAGFEIGADGFRMNPDGTSLEINFFSAAGDATAEAMNQYYLTQWRALSLNVIDNFSYEHVAFHELFDADIDDDRIDVFIGAWSKGTNPSPYGLYGRTQPFNYSRYVSARNDELMARIDSPESAMDPEYRAEAFAEWQAYMAENMSMIPTLYRMAFIPVNNRVTNYEINATPFPRDGWHRVGFTSETPYVNGQ